MERKTARELVSRFRGVRVCVLGDLMLDLFIRGKVSRISPEAPVPVVEIESEELRLGGAGNVAHNIVSLGGDPVLVSVVGEDNNGERLLSALRENGLSTAGIVQDADRPTTVKSRIIAHSQQMIRIDRESRKRISTVVEKKLVGNLLASLPDAQAVLVSDYAKGVITPATMHAARRRREIPVLIDPKVPHYQLYKNTTIITPNVTEAEHMSGIAIEDLGSLNRAGRRIMSHLRCPYLLITRGEDGMSLFDRSEPEPVHIPARGREVYDVTGAGDTVIAAFALARSAGASWLDAAVLANHAAGIVVGRIGTAVVTADELIESFR